MQSIIFHVRKRNMLHGIIKTMVTLIMVEGLFFFVMIFFLMSDEGAHPIGQGIYYTLSNFFSYPLVLLDKNYPFFLESKEMPTEIIPMIMLNVFLQSLVIIFGRNLILRLSKKSNFEKSI